MLASVIDPDYHGEIGVLLYNWGKEEYTVLDTKIPQGAS